MRVTRLIPFMFVLSIAATAPLIGAKSVPFKGSWSGVTTSATFENFPPVVTIVAEGSGHLTHLGRYEMVSPHTTNVFTGETIGDQIFTAANGDTLIASCAGSPQPQPDMSVVGSLDCNITDGTGRFADASGSYVFFLTAVPRTDGGPGYATEADIVGEISF